MDDIVGIADEETGGTLSGELAGGGALVGAVTGGGTLDGMFVFDATTPGPSLPTLSELLVLLLGMPSASFASPAVDSDAQPSRAWDKPEPRRRASTDLERFMEL